jgi:hypothetical protein
MKKVIKACMLLFTFLSLAWNSNAQGDSIIARTEDSLVTLADSIYKIPVPEMRADANFRFGKMLVRALENPNSFEYPFTKLQEKIHIIYPEDKSFRIFNWVLPYSDYGRRYYGAIQMPGKDKLVLHPLKDVSAQHLHDGEDLVLSNGNWYGCEYYLIKTVSDNDGRKYYTLLGYNNDGMYSAKKLVDILTFDNSGKPVFGAPVFALPSAKNNQDFKKRFILEYKKGASISLNFSNDENKITFDRLASEVNNDNLKSTLVPIGQTDGLAWQNGIWNFVRNVIQPLQLKDGQAPLDGVMPGGN